MKSIIISDIHGDIVSLQSIINKIYKFNIDRLIILGDFCSYYSDSLDIADLINNYSSIIDAVRGNCDTDEFIKHIKIDLPIKKDIKINNTYITITHGHIYNPYNLPKECKTIFISGHTHRHQLEKINNIIYANPGSLGKPRDGFRGYLLIENDKISLKDINDKTIQSIKL